MNTTPPIVESQRWTEIAAIWKDNRWLYIMVGLLLGLILTPALEQITGDLNALIGNLVPEAIGIIFTVLILERLAENRTKEELKQRLLNEVRSPSSGTAVTALDWLRRENWIDDDTFKAKSMINVNWEGAYIGDLHLEKARLTNANFKNVLTTVISSEGEEHYPVNLRDADLRSANLSNANLRNANLSNADLGQADLSNAILGYANLSNADLREANLSNADLWEANLSNATLLEANLSNATLREANLSNASLGQADLSNASLRVADLSNATLRLANLSNTDLEFADLSYANLWQADLSYADLRYANLSYAKLGQADLSNASLVKANLRGAGFSEGTIFDEKTMLPDAQAKRDERGYVIYDKYWTPDTDMTRYTHPDHPDFWEPDWVKQQRQQDEAE